MPLVGSPPRPHRSAKPDDAQHRRARSASSGTPTGRAAARRGPSRPWSSIDRRRPAVAPVPRPPLVVDLHDVDDGLAQHDDHQRGHERHRGQPLAGPDQLHRVQGRRRSRTRSRPNSSTLDQADEVYNQVVVKLAATRSALSATQTSIEATKAKVTTERASLAKDAVRSYIGDTSGEAIAGSSRPRQRIADQALYEQVGAGNVVADLRRVQRRPA